MLDQWASRTAGSKANEIFERAQTALYDARGVRLKLDKASDTLVISCSGWVPGLFYTNENVPKHARTNTVWLSDKHNLWYYKGIDGLTSSFEETVALVGELTWLIGPRTSCAIGLSGGGYLALALTSMLSLKRSLAFAPQTALDVAWRNRHGDGRWVSTTTTVHEHLGHRNPYRIRDLLLERRARQEHHVIYSSANQLDVLHARNLEGCPGVHLYEFHSTDHDTSRALLRAGLRAPLLDLFIGGGGNLAQQIRPLFAEQGIAERCNGGP